MQLKRFDTLSPCRAGHGCLLLQLRLIHQRLASLSLPGWASLLTEIDARPAHNLPGSVDDESKPSIVIVERQPMKPHIRANALLADGSDLARPHQDQDLLGLDIESDGNDRGFDLEGANCILDIRS